MFRKLTAGILVFLVSVMLSSSVFADGVTLKTSSTSLGQINKLQVLGGSVTASGSTGIVDVSNLTPAALSPVMTIVATTDTGNTPPTGSTTTQGGTAAAKTGAFKISFTGANGAQQTGWVRVYADGN